MILFGLRIIFVFEIKWWFVLIECLVGYFGIMCKDRCSLNCCNFLICDYVIGWCEDGCVDGWIGDKCIEGEKYRY